MNWWWRRRDRDNLDRQVDAELRDHLERLAADYIAGGIDERIARRRARLQFGGLDQMKERCRDARHMPVVRDVAADLRYAFRMFRRSPGFTLVAVITLAVGIGSTTAVFSIVQAVLLRPLPYRNVDRLVAVWAGHVKEKGLSKVFARYDDFEVWQRHSQAFEQLAAATWATGDQILTGRGSARTALAIPVSVNFFSMLGVSPAIGRAFNRDDLNRGCSVVLSHHFWQSALGTADVVGQSLALDSRSCTVVGVMPDRFAFYPAAAELWTLITPNREQLPSGVGVGVFGRLRPGVSLEQAQTELTAFNQEVHAHDPDGVVFVPRAYPLQDEFTWLAGRNLRLTLLVLFAAVSVVLLIACVNVANLLLGRSLGRQHEFAVRAALGSGRWRVVRQVLTEGLLLSSSGAVLGVALATLGLRFFRALAPVDLPPGAVVSINVGVLAFAVASAISTALCCGLIPAYRASRVDLSSSLRASSRGTVDLRGRSYLGLVLVVVEIVSATVLLVGAGLLTQSLIRLGSAPLGFRTGGVLTASLKLPRTAYSTTERRGGFYDRVITALGSVPSIDGVALATSLVRGQGTNILAVERRPAPTPGSAVPDVGQDSVSPDYFRALEVPLHRGRWFNASDRPWTPPVAIVNDAVVRKYFPDDDAVGQHIRYGTAADAPWLTIVGVVGNQKTTTVYQEMQWVESPVVFRPVLQVVPTDATVLVHTSVPSSTGPILQRVLATVDPDVPVSDVQTLHQRIAKDLAYPQFRATLLGVFAGFALLLAVVGLYGVLSQLVAQRTHEIGLRMALGAQRGQVLTLVLRQGLFLIGTGLILGLAGAAALTRYLQGMLYGLTSLDPVTFVGASALLAAVATFASWMPARCATDVDPLVALRSD
jgi:predicted permease